MKRWLALGCAVAAAFPAQGQESAVPQGYAFERPGVLADQYVWGLAHGVRLLALACAQAGQGAAAEAWVDWQEREAAQIEVMRVALSQYYFLRDDAPPDAIAAALRLSTSIDLAPDALAPACASLAEALAQPRYDLARRRAEFLEKK